jgi:poly(3-hydroxybutyrate) depolymerase
VTRRVAPAGYVLVVLLLLAAPVPARGGGDDLKPGSVLHRSSEKHAHAYSLYVPSNYSPRSSWPLVISSHGRGSSGKREIGQWTGLAKEYGFIVACPDMCTATVNRPPNSKLEPSEEDEEVILSIYEEICRSFRVNRRAVMVTGFSGGGNPSYWTGLRHPDLITHICTRGGNFAPQQIPRDAALVEAGKKRIRVYIYYGDKDHPLILGEGGNPGQAQMAYDALTEAGYEHVKIEKIAGMGHQSRPRIAAAWFGEYLEANRKMFAAGDKADGLLEKIREAVEKEKWRNAVRDLKKLRDLEEKSGLHPQSEVEARKLDEIAAKMLADAEAAHADGDDKEALRIAGRIARDFRGLPAGDRARELEKEWKQ